MIASHDKQLDCVFPTYAGMVRNGWRVSGFCTSFPHVCGDGPFREVPAIDGVGFSPRMWGWSGGLEAIVHHDAVFPTYVGMVRMRTRQAIYHRCFPHVCGDGPLSSTLAA